MAINQVLVEGTIIGDPRATIDKGHHGRFELQDDEGRIFRCKMWLGHPCHCLLFDRVLVIGHLEREGREFLIDVVSLRRMVRVPMEPIEPFPETPEPVEIPY